MKRQDCFGHLETPDDISLIYKNTRVKNRPNDVTQISHLLDLGSSTDLLHALLPLVPADTSLPSVDFLLALLPKFGAFPLLTMDAA